MARQKPRKKSAGAQTRRYLESKSGVFLLSLIFTLALLYNYIVPLNAVPFSQGIKGQDCYQMVWNLWVVNEAITSGRNPYRTEMIYYPIGAELSHHSLAAGFFVVTFPVKLISRGDVMYPFYAYRTIILLSFTLILYLSYLTLRELGFRRWASAIPSVAYAFSAFYMEHLIHLNQIAGFFIPLTALCLVRWYRQPSTARVISTALASSCAIYFTEIALYIYMAVIFLAILMFPYRGERLALVERIRLAGLKRLLLGLTVFLLILAPYLFNFFTHHTLKPIAAESSLYSSNLAGFFIPKAPFYSGLFLPLGSRITAGMGEPGIFLGFPLLIFGFIGLLVSRRTLTHISALAALLFFVLSLGPTLKVFAADTGIPLPYALLMRIPPFDAGRTPVRFVSVGMFFLMIVASGGLRWAEKTLSKRWGSHWSGAAMSLLLIWTIAEAYAPIPRQKPFVKPSGLEKILDGAVLNLPLMKNDGYSEALQIFNRQPIASGFLARYTQEQSKQFADLERLFNRGGTKFCEGVAARGYRNIVIAPRDVFPDAPSIAPLELSKCSLNVVDLRTGDLYSRAKGAELGEGERPDEFPPYIISTRVDFRSAESDKFLWYGWSGRELAFRWTYGNSAAVVFALRDSKPTVLRIKLGVFLVPGRLEEQRVNIALNGRQITTLRLREAEPREYSLVLPVELLREKNVLSFNLPDAESPATFGLSDDARLLGINVHWIEFDSYDTRPLATPNAEEPGR